MTEIELETKVISKFVSKHKRDRYIGFIQKEKSRSKFLNDLSHGQMFEDDLFEKIDEHESDVIKNIAKRLGLKDCYIISTNKDIDGRRFAIDEIINKALSPWADTGTLIIFGDAEIIYREHEGPMNKWLSKI